MKNTKRNLAVLITALGVIFYGTFLVVSSTAVPLREKAPVKKPDAYALLLQRRLLELIEKKEFAEAEIVFRRLRKIKPVERNILRWGALIFYHNGKLNEAENLLRNLLLRDPGDFVCRNNYGMILLAKRRAEAFRELDKAWHDSGKKAYIGRNLLYCAEILKIKLPYAVSLEQSADAPVPREVITRPEEKK